MTLENEVARGRREGVVKDANMPFLLEPDKTPEAGVLLVHGFTASPWEMRFIGEALVRSGYLVLGVRLPGHGTTAEDLVHRRYEEWMSAVDRGYALLGEKCLRCYGVGMSTGALLLLALATRRPLQGLILLSPFLKMRHPLAPATFFLRFFRRFQRREVAEPVADYYYSRRPVNGIYQLCRLTRKIRKALPAIHVPTLVLSSAGDRTVDPESSRDLFQLLGSRHKEFHCFGPEVPHILSTPENPRWQETLQLTRDFLQRLETSSSLAQPASERVV